MCEEQRRLLGCGTGSNGEEPTPPWHIIAVGTIRAVCSLRRIGLSLLNPLVQLVLLRARDPQPNLKKPKCHPFKARHRRDAGKGVIFDIVHISRIIKSRNFRNDVISKKFRIFCKVYALISFIISIHYRQLLK